MDSLCYDQPQTFLIYARPGFGKTTFVKYLISQSHADTILIISRHLEDYQDYSSALSNSKFDETQINIFLMKQGTKLLILDDILHLKLASGTDREIINSLLSTSRHHKLSIIVSTQLLGAIGKAFRLLCHIFITGNIDDESVKLLRIMTGESKKILDKIKLQRYQFLIVDHYGLMEKVRLTM